MKNIQPINFYVIIFLLTASQSAYAERIEVPAGKFPMGLLAFVVHMMNKINPPVPILEVCHFFRR